MKNTTAPTKVIPVRPGTKADFDAFADRFGWLHNRDRAVSTLLRGWDELPRERQAAVVAGDHGKHPN